MDISASIIALDQTLRGGDLLLLSPQGRKKNCKRDFRGHRSKYWDAVMEESNSAAKLFFPSSTSETHQNPRKRQRSRKMKKRILLVLDDGGCLVEVELDFKQSSWYTMSYVVVAPHTWNRRFMDKFRRRFRMPYESYLELVEICKTKKMKKAFCTFGVGQAKMQLELSHLHWSSSCSFLGRSGILVVVAGRMTT